jgi:hypothetical protein
MRAIIEPPPTGEEPPGIVRKLAWFFSLAVASAGVVIAIAYALRALLR